jgi:hypothetical protein
LSKGFYRVDPHVLRRTGDAGREEVACATVDDLCALVVPVSVEAAERVSGVPAFEGMEAFPVTVEEIEGVCKTHDLVLVGLYGLEGPEELSVVSVEVVEMALVKD